MTNRLRCPSCGREDVDRIVYGLVDAPPSDEENIRYGGCIVLPARPDFHCNRCDNEWAEDDSPDGRQRPTAEGEPDPYEDLQEVEAWTVGDDGSSSRVLIDGPAGRATWTSRTAGPEGTSESGSTDLDPEQVRTFIEGVRGIDPLRWKGRYHAACILDGSSWGVRILTGTRMSRRVGANAGPRGWDQLRELVARVLGRPFL